MAVLFVSEDTIKKSTTINGNVDVELLLPYIKVAQDIHIHQLLGTDLYDKISADIIAGSLAGDYLALINDYIQPMLIHYAMAEYLPFAAYTIANGGVYKHNSENSSIASKEEVDLLINRERDYAEYYTQRFIDYMSFNADSKFPEYYTNSNEDIYPDKDALFHGWNL